MNIDDKLKFVINEFTKDTKVLGIGPKDMKIILLKPSFKEIIPFVDELDGVYFNGLLNVMAAGAMSIEFNLGEFNDSKSFWAVIVNNDVFNNYSYNEQKFLIGHECGHIINGDLLPGGASISSENIIASLKAEEKADEHAYSIGGRMKINTVYSYVLESSKATFSAFPEEARNEAIRSIKTKLKIYVITNIKRIAKAMLRNIGFSF